jgi:predicted membrane protein
VTSQDFQGGEVSAIFGGMELDLRDAGLAGGTAIIDATVVCGGIELRVPRDWRVNIQTTTLLGGVENKRSQPNASDVKGELTITGAVLCGGIEVKD